MTKELKLVEVYRALGEADALIIKSLLESRGIHVFTVDGLGEYRVMVSESKAEAAKRLIGEEKSG
jgi:hypothetical protein